MFFTVLINKTLYLLIPKSKKAMTFQKLFVKSIMFMSYALGLSQISPQFSPIPSDFGIINCPNPVHATDIEYDTIETDKQAFHLFLPNTTGTYPLVIFIHGGGFISGSRDVVFTNSALQNSVKYFLENGIAFASIGYRLLPESTPIDPIGVKKCLGDSKYALQFIRHYADELHVNPDKIALTGESAGAGTSLWLATHPDMANSSATDPVLQESTRICAAYLSASQATYDLYKWETQVYNNFDGNGTDYTLDDMIALISFDLYSSFYGGLDTTYQIIQDPDLIQYREDVDMLYHMSNDDPALYITHSSMAVHPSEDLFHHAFHAREIHNTAIANNITILTDVPALSINTTQGTQPNEFLKNQLTICSATLSDKNESINTHITIHPNPSDWLINIRSISTQMITDIVIFSMNGNIVLEEHDINLSFVTLNSEVLKPGVYLVLVTKDQGDKSYHKIVIK